MRSTLSFGGLDTREQPHFLQYGLGQVLRLIDHQHHLAAGCILLDQEFVQGGEQLRLLHLERLEAKLHQHRLQKLDRGHLGLVDLRDDHVVLQLSRKVSISVVLPQPISPVITTKPSANHTVDSM